MSSRLWERGAAEVGDRVWGTVSFLEEDVFSCPVSGLAPVSTLVDIFTFSFSFSFTFSFSLAFGLVIVRLSLGFSFGGLHHNLPFSNLLLLASSCGFAIRNIAYAIGSFVASGSTPSIPYCTIIIRAFFWFSSGKCLVAFQKL